MVGELQSSGKIRVGSRLLLLDDVDEPQRIRNSTWPRLAAVGKYHWTIMCFQMPKESLPALNMLNIRLYDCMKEFRSMIVVVPE